MGKYIYSDEYDEMAGPARLSKGPDVSRSGTLKKGEARAAIMSGLTLRRAVFSDNRFIGLLSRTVFKIYGPYEDILPEWFRSERGVTTIIACREKTPIGFAMLSEPSDRYDLKCVSELLGIAVEPSMQGKGIGEMLLCAIERKSLSINVKWIFLHTAVENMSARRLYERMGYGALEVKRCFYPEGQDAMVMYKALKG